MASVTSQQLAVAGLDRDGLLDPRVEGVVAGQAVVGGPAVDVVADLPPAGVGGVVVGHGQVGPARAGRGGDEVGRLVHPAARVVHVPHAADRRPGPRSPSKATPACCRASDTDSPDGPAPTTSHRSVRSSGWVTVLNARGWSTGKSTRVQTGCFPLLFAALTGRSGHGLARMSRIRSPGCSASWIWCRLVPSPKEPALFSLAGKVAVVTGAASGIGLATARRFAAAGATGGSERTSTTLPMRPPTSERSSWRSTCPRRTRWPRWWPQ